MKKRSAMVMAAGLVLALLVGVAGLSVGLAGPDTAGASGTSDPIVRTEHETVTVHRDAKAEPAETVEVVRVAQTTPAAGDVLDDGGHEDEDEEEDEDHDDGDDHDEDRGDDDHEDDGWDDD